MTAMGLILTFGQVSIYSLTALVNPGKFFYNLIYFLRDLLLSRGWLGNCQ